MTSSRDLTFVIILFLVTQRCTNGSDVTGCPDNQVACDDGVCIPNHWLCDGTDDCRTGDDEMDCLKHCPSHYFHCVSGDACIPPTWLCNGSPDCPDSSDEDGPDCKAPLSSCPKPQVLCGDQYDCIYPAVKCDGFRDCQDGSDEELCDHLNCLDGEFACANKERCIPDKWQCDGNADCQDGSDENSCDKHCSILDGLFLCASSPQCILLSHVCDGNTDCMDNTDENLNCSSSCDDVMCDYACQRMPSGPGVCVCASGYKLSSDDINSCRDLDECTELSVSPCSQICGNLPGTYACSCHPGYRLANDKHACKAEASDAILLYGLQTKIRSFNLHNGDFSDVHTKLHAVNAVTYDLVSERLFWSDAKDKAVYASYMNGLKTPIINTGLSQPEGLAVDWIGRSLYVIDSGKHAIIVCSLTRFFCATLIRDLQQPKNIVIDAVNRYLYWTDTSTSAYIGRCTLDGATQTQFVSSNIEYPMGLFLDYGRQRLFWTDMRSKTIQSIRLDGTDRKVVAVENIKLPVSVAVFEDTLIWADLVKDAMFLTNMTSGRKLKRVTKINDPASIVIIHPTQQPTVTNPCLTSRCDHVCVQSNRSSRSPYKCLCASGYNLDEENGTCTERDDNNYLLISRHGQIVRVQLDYIGTQPPVSIIRSPNLANVIGLAYSPLEGAVIYSDVARDVIASINLKQRHPKEKILVHQGVQTVEDLAVDWIGSNLYWTDSQKKTVEVARLAGTSRRVLIKSELYKPHAIVIHPVQRYLFFSSVYPSGSHIVTCHLDGTRQTVIISDAGRVYGMYMDMVTSLLYWVDSQFGSIESCELDGSDRHIVKEGLKHPYSLTLSMGYFYWTNGETSQLRSLAMHSDHVTISNLDDTSSSDNGMMGIISIIPGNYTGMSTASSRCYPFNGGCSALCFSEPNVETSVVCQCPTGQHLNEDLATCTDGARCGDDEFECTVSGQCIAESEQCDGIVQCPQAEDEHAHCLTCDAHQYRCKSGQCIPRGFLCDGDPECKDGSDEGKDGGCSEQTCTAGYFACDAYKCITEYLVCDNFRDCPNGQDEMNCTAVPDYSNEVLSKDECGEDMYQCVNHSKCISSKFICDEYDDCPYGDDENCPVTCDEDEVLCPDGDCIAKVMLCDELDDCSNGWDETNCSVGAKVAQCDEGLFACQSGGLCLSHKWVCDGTLDCDGGEDEKKSLCACTAGMFHCGVSDTCIQMNKVCDNVSDCEDSSDEGAHCGALCSLTCSQNCHPTPAGGICSCYHGYHLQKDHKTCKDIDECVSGDSQCSQICVNTPGSYRCSCLPGYSLHLDQKTCKADGRRPYLLIGRSSRISVLSYDGHHISSLPYRIAAPVISIDNLDPNDSKYWSTEKAVFVDGEPLNLNISSVGSVVVDWVGKNIYITEPSGGNILACAVNGAHCITVVSGLGEPRGLAVYPQKGLMFWTETQSQGKICHSWMDGSNPAPLVIGGMSQPICITVDYSTDKLYWVDTDLGNLEMADLDGRNRRLLLQQANTKLFGIDVFEDWILVGDWTKKEIKRVKRSGDKEEVIRGNISQPQSIHVVHIARKPSPVNNTCSQLACDCLCLLTPGGGRCMCPEDVTHQPRKNNRDCDSDSTFCLNSAICKMVDHTPQCMCTPGFIGIHCEQVLPGFSSSPAPSSEDNVSMTTVPEAAIEGDHSGNSHMWIIGVVVFVLLLGIITATLCIYLRRKNYRKGVDIFTLIRYHNPLSRRKNEEAQTIVQNTEQLSFTNPGFEREEEEEEDDDIYSDIYSNKINVCIKQCSFSTSEDSLDSAIDSARTSMRSSKECTYRNFPIDENIEYQ